MRVGQTKQRKSAPRRHTPIREPHAASTRQRKGTTRTGCLSIRNSSPIDRRISSSASCREWRTGLPKPARKADHDNRYSTAVGQVLSPGGYLGYLSPVAPHLCLPHDCSYRICLIFLLPHCTARSIHYATRLESPMLGDFPWHSPSYGVLYPTDERLHHARTLTKRSGMDKVQILRISSRLNPSRKKLCPQNKLSPSSLYVQL